MAFIHFVTSYVELLVCACAVEEIKSTVVVSQQGSLFIPNFVLGVLQI